MNVDGTIGYLECDSRLYILGIFSFHVINSGNIVSGTCLLILELLE